MSLKDTLARIEEKLDTIMKIASEGINAQDTIIVTDTQHVKDDSYMWGVEVSHPDPKLLPLQITGFAKGHVDKASMMALWAGLQLALHLPKQTPGIHIVNTSAVHLDQCLIRQTKLKYDDPTLNERLNSILDAFPEDRISKESLSYYQRQRYIDRCSKILDELRKKLKSI